MNFSNIIETWTNIVTKLWSIVGYFQYKISAILSQDFVNSTTEPPKDIYSEMILFFQFLFWVLFVVWIVWAIYEYKKLKENLLLQKLQELRDTEKEFDANMEEFRKATDIIVKALDSIDDTIRRSDETNYNIKTINKSLNWIRKPYESQRIQYRYIYKMIKLKVI